ncbi:MAG: aminodeoxychorismate/anthranilate synthase component II [Ancalomicrobiaceae bacterium]|nr:aminodeoxychorismate/anthranilate synthase component II [Ancalomicrobiaceae bacterium]
MYLLIDNYDSFTYNLYHFLGEEGAAPKVIRNDKISVDEVEALDPEAIILSPGPCTPNEAGICLNLIERLGATIPIFGVCLGHQAIGQAYGGEVKRAPKLMHGKVSEIRHTGRGVFRGINGDFAGARYHSLIVERATMPTSLDIVAETSDGLVMGIAHRDHPVHGVQFHPESIASENGHRLIRNFLDIAAEWNATRRGRPSAA